MKKSATLEWQPLETIVPAEMFLAEVRYWAQRLEVEPREVRLQYMKRKWASCSTRGRLTFCTELLRQPAAFRREVIIHELLHLKLGHGSHGKLFRALMRAYLNE